MSQFRRNLLNKIRSSERGRSVGTVSHCQSLVQRHDKERYLMAILVEPDNGLRRLFLAMLALNVEAASIPDVVKSDPKLGLVRTQFWTDRILEKSTHHVSTGNPLLDEVKAVQMLFNMDPATIDRMADVFKSRQIFFQSHPRGTPFQTTDILERYLSDSVGSIYTVWLACAANVYQVGQKEMKHVTRAAKHLALAEGYVMIIRGLVNNARRGSCYAPLDLLSDCKVKHTNLVSGETGADVRRLVEILASRAQDNVDAVEMRRKFFSKCLPASKCPFFDAISTRRYLDRLATYDCDIYHTKLIHRDDPMLALQIYLTYWRHKFTRC